MREFEGIFVLGRGRVALQCQKRAEDFFARPVKMLENFDARGLDAFFEGLKKALIISCNNDFYIFKPPAISQNTIINYHNSLLPKHRGMGAHIWAIFEGDAKTGISWHRVDEGLDTGDILAQKEIILDENSTALSLLKAQHDLALASLGEALGNLQRAKSYPQARGGSYHARAELPGGGILDLAWEREKIFAFLRAMEGRGGRVRLLGQELEIVYYENFKLILSDKTELIIKIGEENARNCGNF